MQHWRLNAALGCAQFEQLPSFLDSKRILFNRYKEAFRNISQVDLYSEPESSHSNYWLQTLILDESVSNQKDDVLETTISHGIMTRPAWTLLHKLSPFQDCHHAQLKVSKSLERRIINLPSSVSLV